jgi:hypothetical protein
MLKDAAEIGSLDSNEFLSKSLGIVAETFLASEYIQKTIKESPF